MVGVVAVVSEVVVVQVQVDNHNGGPKSFLMATRLLSILNIKVHIDSLWLEARLSHLRSFSRAVTLAWSCSGSNLLHGLFMTKRAALIDKYVPAIITNKSHKGVKRFSNDTLRAIKKTHRAWRRYMETRSGQKYQEYVRQRNKVTKLTKQAQKEYEKTVARQVKDSPKKFWKFVKSKTKSPSNIPDLYNEDDNHSKGLATDDKEKADILAEFYSSVFTKEPPGPIPEPKKQYLNSELRDTVFAEDRIKKKLMTLKTSKSPGPYQLHPRILKEMSHVITKPLQQIFTFSMNKNKLPSIWKKANVSPIFKKGKKQSASNYRLVSLTCILCKFQESLIRDDIVAHMEANSLISKRQFGLMSGRSTILQLLHVMDEWTNILDSGGTIEVCYMDFMKAFDKVHHKRLLAKNKTYGIEGNILKWIKEFLENRQQRVIVNGNYSDWSKVTSGIPQGSVLGPLLFVLYINDLPDCILSQVFLFTDGTKMFHHIQNSDDQKIFQDNITRLQAWTDKWLLKFHPEKCELLAIGKRTPSFKYTMYTDDLTTISLSRVQTEKDVGLTFDEDMTFRHDITLRATKANNIMGIIRRNNTYLDIESFKLLFKSLVRPHLEYGAPVWNPRLKRDIAELEKVQRRATKQVPALKNMSYPDRLRKLSLLTLCFGRLRGDMIEAYKLLKGIYDISLPALITPVKHSKTCGHRLKLPKNRAEPP